MYKFPSKVAFDACDFSKAVELASTKKSSYTYKATSSGTFFFGCQIGSHCKMGQKLALTVGGMFP